MNNIKPKPVVGQILYSLNVGNAARNCPQVLTPVKVTKVGRKYFECNAVNGYPREVKFHLDTWREEAGGYCARNHLYETEQEWFDERDRQIITDWLRNDIFNMYTSKYLISLKALRAIEAIIKQDLEHDKKEATP